MTIPQSNSTSSGATVATLPTGKLWPSPGNPTAVARRFIKGDKRLLIRIDGEWLVYRKNYWESVSSDRVGRAVRLTLEKAEFQAADGSIRGWHPTDAKVREVLSALHHIATPKYVLGKHVSNEPEAGWFGKPKSHQWHSGAPDQVIPCSNGLLRIADRKLLPFSPLHFNRYVLNCPYDRNATSDLWDSYSQSSFDAETIGVVEEWCGYVLSGRLDMEMYLLLIGPTRSGKGTLVKVLKAFLPPSAVTGFSPTQLRDRFGKENLVGKSLIVMSDNRANLRDSRFAEFVLETVGLDDQSIRPAYARNYEVFNGPLPGRIMLLSNEPPLIPDNSDAIAARTLSLVTQKSFKGMENKRLKTDLVAPENLSAILNRFLDGLDRLNKRGRFEQPQSGQVVLEMIGELGSEVKQFVSQRCELAHGEKVLKSSVYQAYQQFCMENNFETLAANAFSTALFTATEHSVRPSKVCPKGETNRNKKVPVFVGMKLKENSRVETALGQP